MNDGLNLTVDSIRVRTIKLWKMFDKVSWRREGKYLVEGKDEFPRCKPDESRLKMLEGQAPRIQKA